YALPVISGFLPTNGSAGVNVTITGSNFLGTTAVRFNGLNSSFTTPISNTSLQAVVPTNAPTGLINVIPPAGSSTSSNVFVVSSLSDRAVSMTANPDPVFVGSNLTYTLVVTNAGPLNAPNVMLTNTLPASVAFQSASTSQGALSVNGTMVVGSF